MFRQRFCAGPSVRRSHDLSQRALDARLVGPKPAGRAFVGDRTVFRLTTCNFSANNKRSALRGKWKGNVTSPDLRGLVERDRIFDNFASARYTAVGLASTLPKGKKSSPRPPPEPVALMVPFCPPYRQVRGKVTQYLE